jgi:hypothetical protein
MRNLKRVYFLILLNFILICCYYLNLNYLSIKKVSLESNNDVRISWPHDNLEDNNNNNNVKKKSIDNMQANLDVDCSHEWVILNNDAYFRPNLAFYYTDLDLIRIHFNKRTNSKLDIHLLVKLNNILNYNLTNIVYKNITKHSTYSFGSIEAYLNITNSLSLVELKSLQVYVYNKNNIESTKNPINLIIKKFQADTKLKENSIVCSKIYYVTSEYSNQFKWWIEMNQIHKYNKIVIYNNSIENCDEFNKLFEDYKHFVQIIQFKCIPNFIDKNNTNKPFIKDFNEIKNAYKLNEISYHVFYETFVFTECYLTNKDKYKYVTVNDQDETVIPRYINNFREINNDLIDKNYQFLKDNQIKCTNPINSSINFYLNQLNNNLISNITYHFHTGIYMKEKTMNVLFDSLGKLLSAPSLSLETNISLSFNIKEEDEKNNRNGGQLLNFNMTIKNRNEYLYAQYLYKLYTQIMKPFYEQNQIELKKIYEPFSRLFYLLGPSTTWFCGKTIHNTFLAEHVTTHYPNHPYTGMMFVPIEKGHVSHFRNGYNIYWNDKSIMDLQFDLNYFLCYLKPISKKFDILLN